VFIHWEAKDDKKIQDFNYRVTKEALARAIKGEPKASEVTAKKDSAHHPFSETSTSLRAADQRSPRRERPARRH
jgi:formaldehyde-activating enzyme involved in methanogenesis